MALTVSKKLKKGNDSIFFQFRKDAESVKHLENAYENMLKGYSRMNLCLQQISESDARSSRSFTQSTCDVNPYKENKMFVVYAIGNIFFDGMHVLKKYLYDTPFKVPTEKEPREALERLLIFLSRPHDALTSSRACNSECDWAITVAQHLFSELSVESKYAVDCNYQTDRLPKDNCGECVCPCEYRDNLQGNFDDTSFGCSDGWHGHADILMDSVSVRLIEETSTDCDQDSSMEVEISEEFSLKDLSQIRIQTIVFSFLHQHQTNYQNHTLVPSLGVNREKLVVNFYDCLHDVLLSTCSLNMFKHFGEDKFLNTEVMLLIWLVFNHRYFCSGVTESMKQYKSNFFQHAGDCLDMYKQCVTRKVNITRDQPDLTLLNTWADEHGKVEDPVVKITCEVIEH